jgi:hypothetical protein
MYKINFCFISLATNIPRLLSSDILKEDLTLDLMGATKAVALTIVKAIKIEENIFLITPRKPL